MTVVSSDVSKNLANYPTLEILNAEIKKHPSLWIALGELHAKRNMWVPPEYCFFAATKDYVVGYSLMEFVLINHRDEY